MEDKTKTEKVLCKIFISTFIICTIIFFILVPFAIKDILSNFGMVITILSGCTSIISIFLSIGFVIAMDLDEIVTSWEDFNNKVEKYIKKEQ